MPNGSYQRLAAEVLPHWYWHFARALNMLPKPNPTRLLSEWWLAYPSLSPKAGLPRRMSRPWGCNAALESPPGSPAGSGGDNTTVGASLRLFCLLQLGPPQKLRALASCLQQISCISLEVRSATKALRGHMWRRRLLSNN
jgi:hypothetical protein